MHIDLQSMLENVRKNHPLVHNITNYVTVNDCANILLASGASPIMADDAGEVEEISALCAALNLNIGTLNARTIPAMFLAGRQANALHHPVILDPVGAGASALRTDTARRLLEEVRFACVRANVSEIKALALDAKATKGVDADVADAIDDDSLDGAIDFAQRFAQKTQAVVAITGAIDIVADASRAAVIRNGHPILSRITGSGCMLTAMTAAYLAANPGYAFEAVTASVCAMGLCGERAQARLEKMGGGNATFRNFLIDEVFALDGAALEKGAKYAVR